ncbi:MAG: precorrin-8X methylmutase [Pseudomonadota bacterium]
MSAPLFDVYVMVDWSAASKPTTGTDSIWIGVSESGETSVENIATRAEAMDHLSRIAHDAIDADKRVLIGFDFPFGYPVGVAKTLTGEADALALWAWLAKRIEDGPDNANNRYAVADEINRVYFDGTGPFWGRPASWPYLDVPTKASSRAGRGHPAERRLADRTAKGAKTVWQLAYAGSVGSQVLLGIPAVHRLRHDPRLADHTRIWPFETGLTAPADTIVLAEIYPSLIPPDPTEAIKDAGQVRAVADWLAGLDRDGALATLFAGPPDATADQRRIIATEEAWILGLGAPAVRAVGETAKPSQPPAVTASAPPRAPAPAPRSLSYQRDPAEIYRQSFDTVRTEARLDHLPEDLHPVAIRLVHACGMPDITARLAWSADIAESARAALTAGKSVLCDCEAVASMVIPHRLPARNPVRCTLRDPDVPEHARRIANTRSAAAVEFWRDEIDGALVAIGNAPTALFHLLELFDQGWPRPAAILGFPVGFVGAAESKAELAANPRATPFLTLRGRRGGSAMAAAAVNALAAGLATP